MASAERATGRQNARLGARVYARDRQRQRKTSIVRREVGASDDNGRRDGLQGGPTNAEDDVEDDEGVHHGEQRRRDGRDHLGQLAHSPEEPDDAHGTHQAHHPVGDVERPEVEERHEDDEDVEPVPSVAHKGLEPVGEEVDGELDGEDGGEDVVDAEDQGVEGLRVDVFVLGVQHAHNEVLHCPCVSLDRDSKVKLLSFEKTASAHRYDQDSEEALEKCRSVHLLHLSLSLGKN
jgi:hypothetical protein